MILNPFNLLDDELEPDPNLVPLIDYDDLRAAIGATTGSHHDDSSEPSYEEGRRLAALRRLRDDPEALLKTKLFGDDAMLARLADVRRACPNFSAVVDMIVRAARASIIAKAPLRLRPFVLLGSPGIGKTHFSRLLADALGTTTAFVPANTMAETGVLVGFGPVWRGAKMGAVAAALLACNTLSPIVLIDEVEKIRVGDRGQPLDALLGLLEEETASRFKDDWLDVPMKGADVIYCLTANDLSSFSAPLLDRLIVFSIDDLGRDQQDLVIVRMFDEINARLNDALDALDRDVIAKLRGMNPRRAKAAIDLAAGYTLADGRGDMTVDDVAAAMKILAAGDRKRRTIGFGVTLH